MSAKHKERIIDKNNKQTTTEREKVVVVVVGVSVFGCSQAGWGGVGGVTVKQISNQILR